MDFENIRRLTITALFSDDVLFDQIVLKGGNAMALVHKITSRTSLDLDFSMETDFDDLEDIQKRMHRALTNRFAPHGLIPFDVKFQTRPSMAKDDRHPKWGGYKLEFKLVDEDRYQRYGSDIDRLRRESVLTGPGQLKVFTVDFSKWEFTGRKTRTEMDSYTIFVYSTDMIALEKVRAICQQMEEYPLARKTKSARARDFYDIRST